MFFKNKLDSEKKYKFKHLLVYGSTEWMIDSTKRYRLVYDNAETDYMNAELAFYNKLFDEEDWKCKITLKAFKTTDLSKALCTLESDREVKKDENIVFVRDGWGNATIGKFWTAATYVWVAYIDGEEIGRQEFIVNNVGLVNSKVNPYFSVEHLKLFSGPYEGWKTPESQRKYLTKFNKKTTAYVWCEFKIKVLTNKAWNYELFFNFYDDAGQAKARTPRKGFVDKNKQNFTYTFDVGWGNETPGSWKDDKYTLEIVFMDTLVAAVAFECGEQETAGDVQLISSVESTISTTKGVSNVNQQQEKSLDELLEELNSLIGLQNVKQKIEEQITYINFNKLRKEKGLEVNDAMSVHAVAIGNPGTGKTTVMRLLGKIYHQLGLLSSGHLVEVDRVDLVGEFIGQTAPKTQKVIDEARGGILFIDEAYALFREGESAKDYGKEVIEILIKEMSDGIGDIAIFVAGYPKEMTVFLASNPGLKSRFNQYFSFEDYLPQELFDIALYITKKKKLILANEAHDKLLKYLTEAYRKRDKSFGNARFVEGIISAAQLEMGKRLMQSNKKDFSKDELSTILLEDIQQLIQVDDKKQLKLQVDTDSLQLALNELHEMIGLETVKQEIDELVRLIMYYNEIGKDILHKFSLHSIYAGNPGTGKTTVARIMGKVFKALGILERGHVVEVDREQLVAGYVGQTAIKTAEKIDEAMGGVLFIDEAYSLAQGGHNDSGKEAIEVILKRMEDNRGKFVVLAAGYTDNMNDFLLANPGLDSRFDKKLHFDDYAPEQLFQIALLILSKDNLQPTEAAKNHLIDYFTTLYKNKDKYFGNARVVRKTIEEAIKNQNLRMAKIEANKRTIKDIETLTIEDVEEFTFDGNLKKTIGFKK
ncbi:MAG: AAA family ATPase [Chitinophagales bacterium]|nr:AAA family ATPase [Chitinophagales bacterium]